MSPGAAGSWLCWESSAGRCCRQRSAPSGAPPCGSVGVRPGRRSCHTRGSNGVSSGSASVAHEGRERSADTGCSSADSPSASFCGSGAIRRGGRSVRTGHTCSDMLAVSI